MAAKKAAEEAASIAAEKVEAKEAKPIAAEKVAEEAAPVAAENAEAKELAKETMAAGALESLAVTSEIMLCTANAAVNDAVASALWEKPEVSSNLINLTRGQRIILQKMVKEAVLYSLFLSMGAVEVASRNKKLVDEIAGAFVCGSVSRTKEASNAC